LNGARDIWAGDLPESVLDIVGVIGLAKTLTLIERFGGTRIYIPSPDAIDEQHPLGIAIGVAAARALAPLYCTLRPEIPRAADAVRRARNRLIRQEAETASEPKLALRHGLTERQIRNILNLPDDVEARVSRQARLF
jgi:Mor family transcriptional regulator